MHQEGNLSEKEHFIQQNHHSDEVTEDLKEDSNQVSRSIFTGALRYLETSVFAFLTKFVVIVAISFWTGYSKSLKASLVGRIAAAVTSQHFDEAIYYVSFLALQFVAEKLSYTARYMMGDVFAYVWRKNLTKHVMSRYLATNYYYKLNVLDRTIDNTDQRIADDINSLTQDGSYGFAGLVTKIGTCIFLVEAFVTKMDWRGSLGLCLITSFLGVILAYLGNKKAKLIFTQDHLEGDYRYAHIRVRLHAESIAFFSGEDHEKVHLDTVFEPVVQNYRKLLTLNFWMNSITELGETTVGQAGACVVLVITLWPSKALSEEEIKHFSEIYSSTLSAAGDFFSEFFDIFSYFNPLSTAYGNLKRIDQLIDIFNKYDAEKSVLDTPKVDEVGLDFDVKVSNDQDVIVNLSRPSYLHGNFIQFEHVTSQVPTKGGRILAKDLSFVVKPGQNLLITGSSGCGKSSILRNLSGIWPISEGTITSPRHIGLNGIMYMPQEPYFVIGNLKEQICYPETRTDLSDRTLQKYLDMVGLSHLTERPPENLVDWKRELSKGEQQRLVMARLFYHRPMFALLDESTSALDHEWERVIHGLCQRFNISLISVGHRKSLYNYHQTILCLYIDGSWEMHKSKPTKSKFLIKKEGEEEDKEETAQVPSRLYHVPFIPAKDPQASKREGTKSALNSELFSNVWKIIKMSQLGGKQLYWNIFLLVLLIILSFSDLAFTLLLSEASFQILSSLVSASKGGVSLWLVILVGCYIVSSFLYSGSLFITSYIGWSWRTGGTRQLHMYYMNKKLVYYNLMLDRTIDNPDQRIASDLKSFFLGVGTDNPWSLGVVETFAGTLRSVILIVGIGIYSMFSVSYLPPLFLFAYNLVSYVPVHFLMQWLSETVYRKEKLEGDFRFLQAHIRENSESIAFYKAESCTMSKCDLYFNKLLAMQWENLIRKFQLDCNFFSVMSVE
eukprot:TRINITY_DN9066_c0_g1_i2.p1 TRINITY_DN9066_c0_g1~~TRINITY_DN9066_c0_g1_i2.p1  ORF type:complete len:951 (+),score=163.93 TRINITY_DN9066_c0_g1_i2:67-2919(+)